MRFAGINKEASALKKPINIEESPSTTFLPMYKCAEPSLTYFLISKGRILLSSVSLCARHLTDCLQVLFPVSHDIPVD